MKKTIFLLLLLSSGLLLRAQEVAVSYDFEPIDEQRQTLRVYLQSTTEAAKTLRGINLSFAMPEGCVSLGEAQSLFRENWTEYLEENRQVADLDLSYGNWQYSQRWQYGNADPGLPATSPIQVPGSAEDRLLVLQVEVSGSCVEQLHLESQAENSLNQFGGANMQPIPWTVSHPRTEISLQEGLSLAVFPNPTHKLVKLQFDGLKDRDYNFQLSSTTGQILQQGVILSNEMNQEIDLGRYAQGVYYLSFSTPEGKSPFEVIKLIKQ
jgi:hypothetical protein